MEVIKIDRFFLKEMKNFERIYHLEKAKFQEIILEKIKIYLFNK